MNPGQQMAPRRSAPISMLVLALALGGCATANPKDPLEPFNRAMFTFNDTLDKAAVKPAAEAYSHLPGFVQTGVANFFGNLGDAWTAINDFLQGKVVDGFTDITRVAINSTLGLGGVIDIASDAGLAQHKEDFGQTLGAWGVKPGPYVVLPILGPSTVRDTAALPLDFAGDPWYYKRPVRWRNTGDALRLVELRAAVLQATNLLEEAALDRYVFIRDAYLQRRQSQVYDGDVPPINYEDDVGPTLVPLIEFAGGPNGAGSASAAIVKLEQNGGNAMSVAKESKP